MLSEKAGIGVTATDTSELDKLAHELDERRKSETAVS